MSQITDNPNMSPNAQFDDDDEINLIDLIYPIYKRRRFLIAFCFIITFLVGVMSFFMDRTYEARAVILPESGEDRDVNVRAAALAQQFGISGIGGSKTTPAAVFEAVLKSNELAMQVLNRYDYFSTMGISRSAEKKTAREIAGQVRVSVSRDNPSITITMQSSDPVFAADIANSYVQALDDYNLTTSFTSARRLREYIEERLKVADDDLDNAQKELRTFQEKNRAISIEKQTEATLEVLAEMESQKVALEVQKAAKERFYKGSHIEIEQLNAQIDAVKRNISRLTHSEEPRVPIEFEQGAVDFYIPLTRIPALNYDESKLLLKVRAKTSVITMLTTQLEQAKLDEAKDIPTINVLETAVPPELPIKPRKKLNVILGFMVSIFLGIFIIFFMEFSQRLEQDPESAPKWKEMKQGLAGLNPLKRIRR